MDRELIGLFNPRDPYVAQLAQIITLFYKMSGKKTSREEIEEIIASDGKSLTENEIQQLLDMQEHFPPDMKLPQKSLGKMPARSDNTHEEQ